MMLHYCWKLSQTAQNEKRKQSQVSPLVNQKLIFTSDHIPCHHQTTDSFPTTSEEQAITMMIRSATMEAASADRPLLAITHMMMSLSIIMMEATATECLLLLLLDETEARVRAAATRPNQEHKPPPRPKQEHTPPRPQLCHELAPK
jgi:hypothetical protein